MILWFPALPCSFTYQSWVTSTLVLASHMSPALELHEALGRRLSSGHSSGPFQSLPRHTHTTLVCSTHEAGEQDSIGQKGSAAKGCNPFISSNPFDLGVNKHSCPPEVQEKE